MRLWSEGLVRQFEAYLIVPFTGAAVRNGIRTLCERDFDLALRQQRPGDGSSQQVLAFVHGARLHQRPEIFCDEFSAEVFDEALRSACFNSLFFKPWISSSWPMLPTMAMTSHP